MKTFQTLLLIFIFAVMPVAGAAQEAIIDAFDAIIKCKDTKVIKQSHSFEKDPESKVKTSQFDLYEFELPASKEKLLLNVLSAFEKDRDMAYSIEQGDFSDKVKLAIGDGSKSVSLTWPGDNIGYSSYIYALFLAPSSEDKEGKYRYAYAMSYTEEKKGIISGALIVTYATTLKHRQEINEIKISQQTDPRDSRVVYTSQGSWFETMMAYFQGMEKGTSQIRIALATKAFKLIQESENNKDVTLADKNAIREILKGMISNPNYSETVLHTLLQQCLIYLK